MKITITIDCDNDAFRADMGADAADHASGDEAARILRRFADTTAEWGMLSNGNAWTIRDRNGNVVASAVVSP